MPEIRHPHREVSSSWSQRHGEATLGQTESNISATQTCIGIIANTRYKSELPRRGPAQSASDLSTRESRSRLSLFRRMGIVPWRPTRMGKFTCIGCRRLAPSHDGTRRAPK